MYTDILLCQVYVLQEHKKSWVTVVIFIFATQQSQYTVMYAVCAFVCVFECVCEYLLLSECIRVCESIGE